MNHTKEFSQLYKDVRQSLSHALTDLSDITVDDETGNHHLDEVRKKLETMNASFNDEMDYLDRNSAEKFTIAFFGETNAGKSTIIESLRILFKEQSRQQLIEVNKARAEDLQVRFSQDNERLVTELRRHGGEFEDRLSNFSSHINALADASRRANQRAIQVAAEASLLQARVASTRLWLGLLIGLLAGLVGGYVVGTWLT
jgi:DNA repair ATPase RecN